jgi:predicted NodU family carbamoyl transferase
VRDSAERIFTRARVTTIEEFNTRMALFQKTNTFIKEWNSQPNQTSTVGHNFISDMTEEEKKLFGIEKLNVPRSKIPAVTHVDYSARVQTIHKQTNPKYHALVSKFKELTGCPVVVNTSFNVRGEPIVCTPEDAFRCLMGTEIEFLVVGNSIMRKEDQDPALKLDYKNAYELD